MTALKNFVYTCVRLLHGLAGAVRMMIGRLFPKLSDYWNTLDTQRIDRKTMDVVDLKGRQTKIRFYTPNHLTRYRAETFWTKEPDTLEWIDRYAEMGGVFADIGANVGLYSIYHALTKKGTAYAFEPSVFNLKLLAKNINLNQCQEHIQIVSNPLSCFNGFADFNLQNTEEGGALSSFGVDYGHDGKRLDTKVWYKMLGFSLDYLVEQKLIPKVPALIKVDVDGIEHLVLRGSRKTLSDPSCRSVLIEVNDSFAALADEVQQILQGTGFRMIEKRSTDREASEQTVNYTFNQIWVK